MPFQWATAGYNVIGRLTFILNNEIKGKQLTQSGTVC